MLGKKTVKRGNWVIIPQELTTQSLNYVNAVPGKASNAINHNCVLKLNQNDTSEQCQWYVCVFLFFFKSRFYCIPSTEYIIISAPPVTHQSNLFLFVLTLPVFRGSLFCMFWCTTQRSRANLRAFSFFYFALTFNSQTGNLYFKIAFLLYFPQRNILLYLLPLSLISQTWGRKYTVHEVVRGNYKHKSHNKPIALHMATYADTGSYMWGMS